MRSYLAIRFAVMCVILGMSASAQAADWTWTTADTVREVVSAGVSVLDYGQTQDIRNHAGMVELNPILGRTPSKQTVRRYFGAVIPLHPLISLALPATMTLWGVELRPRLAWQYIYLGVEGTAVLSNYNGGLRLAF